MDKTSTRDLYKALQNRIILNLEENEVCCNECIGLRFIFVEKSGKGYIKTCNHCFNGKLYTCKHCGKHNKTDHCDCKKAHDERRNAFILKKTQKDLERYEKAEKIHYKNYDGYFILSGSDYIKDIDDVREWICELLEDGEEPPQYLWAVEGTPHFSIDLKDVIYDKCEDGYEDMYSRLDTNSHLLEEAQELINKWENNQGGNLDIYNENYQKVVIIKDLVDEIRSELNK